MVIPKPEIDRPKTAHGARPITQVSVVPRSEPPKEGKIPRSTSSHGSKFVKICDDTESLGTIPEYIKKYKSRVSFENYPESSASFRSSLKPIEAPRPQTRRPQTPKFSTNLEKIPEEHETIGDGEIMMSKFNNEMHNIKVLQKTLEEKVESLDNMLKSDYRKEVENLMKKNEALNKSLKHKADENLKLKQALFELRGSQRSSETASNRT